MPTVKSHCGGTLVSFQRGFDVALGTKFVATGAPYHVTSDIGGLYEVQLSERQQKICKMIKANPRVSVKEMSLVLSLVERTVKRDIAALQKIGVLIREGNTSAGHWVLLKNI